jgi:hypothetical protein
MDVREIGFESGRWIELAQDRVQWDSVVLAVLILWLAARMSARTSSNIIRR